MTPRENKRPLHELVRHATHIFANIYADRLSVVGGGLSLPQLAVLGALLKEGAASQRELCQRSAVDRSTMSTLITDFRKRGYVTATTCEDDLRSQRVAITKDGIAAVRRAYEVLEIAETKFLGRVPREFRHGFVRSLQLIVEFGR